MNWSRLYTSFDGRISRQTFWYGFLPLLAAEIALHSIAQGIEGDRLSAIADLLFVYPECALFAKRAQDRGNGPTLVIAFFALGVFLDFLVITGLAGVEDGAAGATAEPSNLFLLAVVPWVVMALGLLIDLGLRSGMPGPNRYGPDPLEAGAGQ